MGSFFHVPGKRKVSRNEVIRNTLRGAGLILCEQIMYSLSCRRSFDSRLKAPRDNSVAANSMSRKSLSMGDFGISLEFLLQ